MKAKTQQFAVDGDNNVSRDWNPNFREGMVGGLIHGICYFGPEQATKLVKEFDHAKFVAALEAAGLKNIHETFTWKATHADSGAPTPEQIEHACRNFSYKGMGPSDAMALYKSLVDNTFGGTVSAGLNDGKGIPMTDGKGPAGVILSGADELPNKGQRGMLKEFASKDANGDRSSVGYAYDGFRGSLVNQYVMIATGHWKPGPVADESLKLMRIGATDLFYKIDKGYANYAKGKRQGPFDAASKHHGLQFIRPLWDDVIQPYHAKKS